MVEAAYTVLSKYGVRDTREEAFELYERAAREHFREFARTT